jgi:hypothetical protein
MRLARFVVPTMAIATAASFIVPLLAIATAAYSALPVNIGTVSWLLLLFLPQALGVALPIAIPVAVFLGCRRAPVKRQVYTTVGAFTIAGALVTAALNVWVAPVTNAAYRKLAFGDAAGRLVDGRRLNDAGGAGDRFQTRHRWMGPESVLVLAAFAIAASRIAYRQSTQSK